MIDANLAIKENDRAEKQCQDNTLAFISYKKKDLFPKKTGLTGKQREAMRNKAVVKAFKGMQESVVPRNWRIKNKNHNTWIADPPIMYPYIHE